MLIFAPSTRQQRSDTSIHGTIRDRIDAAFSGDIAYLFNSAMQVQRLTQNTRPAYIGKNRSAQLAANNDEYRTAVSLACSSQSIATIGPHNISHVNKLYTQPVPPRNHLRPTPSTPHQSFSLPGDICNTILHAAKNKGAGINADSIDLFKDLVKHPNPSIKPDLHYIFDLIYQNKSPPRQGGTFKNIYVNHTEFRCGTKEQPDTPRQGDVNHTEFRCGTKSTTAAKIIGGDESAGNDTLTKTKSNIILIPPFVTAKSSCNFGSAKIERLNAPQRFPTRKMDPSYKQQSNLIMEI